MTMTPQDLVWPPEYDLDLDLNVDLSVDLDVDLDIVFPADVVITFPPEHDLSVDLTDKECFT